MKILIYGINNSPELTGIGKYTGEMSDWFAANGNEVVAISAPPYYPEWKIHDGYKKYFFSKEFRNGTQIIRCPLFVPRRPNKLKRIIHLISFSISSFFALFYKTLWKPNIIIHVSPTLFCALNTIIFAKITGSRSIIHIQDFEIDAMFGLFKKSSIKEKYLFKKLIFFIEKKIYENYTYVSTISSGMVQKLLQKGIKKEKIILFPNWCELEHLHEALFNKDLLLRLKIDSEKKIILYSGNMGNKQGLEIILDAAKELESDKKLHFMMVGEGSSKEKLIKLSKEYGLANISFHPLQPYELLPDLLASASTHLVIQKKGVADLLLPSKLTNILAVGGNAVITAEKNTTLGDLCNDFSGIAICCEPESYKHLVIAIKKSLEMPTPNLIAKKYAHMNLDKNTILRNFFNTFVKDAR